MPRIKTDKRNVKDVYNLNESFTAGEPFGGTYVYSSNQTLQGWWRLNEDVSTSGDAIDSSFRERDGTFNSAQERPSFEATTAIPTGPEGQTIQTGVCKFEDEPSGNGDDVDIGGDWESRIGLTGTSQVTMAAWVKMDVGTLNIGRLFSFGSPSNLGGFRFIIRTDGDVRLTANWTGSTFQRAGWETNTQPLPIDEWAHIAITYNPGAGASADPQLYINGESLGALPISNAASGTWKGISNNDAHIGAGDGTPSNGVDGIIADAAVWNSILSPDEIKAIYVLSQNQTLTTVSSGYLDNPYRVILNERDNATGSYPTIQRTTGRTVTLGNSPISPYDATREIIFGPADDVHYGDVLQRVDHDKYMMNWIASPNQDDVLGQSYGDPNPKYEMFTTGVVSPFASTQGMKISIDQRGVGSPRHDFEPFDESRVYLGDTSFYKTGTPSNVYPGFKSPLDDKIQIVIPIDSAEESILSRFNAWMMDGDYGSDRYPGGSLPKLVPPNQPNNWDAIFTPDNAGKHLHYWNKPGTEFSGSYYTGFKYYNSDLKVWQDQGFQTGPGIIGDSGADWVSDITNGVPHGTYMPPWRHGGDKRGKMGTFYSMFYHGRPTNNLYPAGGPGGKDTWGDFPTWELELGAEMANINSPAPRHSWPMSSVFKQYQFKMSHHMGFLARTYEELIDMGYDKIGAPTMSGMAPCSAEYHATGSNVFHMSNYISHPIALEKVVIEIPIRVRRKNGNIYDNRPRDTKGNKGDWLHIDDGSPAWDDKFPHGVTVDSAIRDIDNYVFFLYRQSHQPGATRDSAKDFRTSQRFLICSASVACWSESMFSDAVKTAIDERGLPHNPAISIKLMQTHDINGEITPQALSISGSAAAGREGVFTGSIRIEMTPAVASGQMLGGSRLPHRNFIPLSGDGSPFFGGGGWGSDVPSVEQIYAHGAFTPSQAGTMVVQDFWPGGTTFSKPTSASFGTTPTEAGGQGGRWAPAVGGAQTPQIRGVAFLLHDGGHLGGDLTSEGALPLGFSFNGALIKGPNDSGITSDGPAFPSIQYMSKHSIPMWGSNLIGAQGYPERGPWHKSFLAGSLPIGLQDLDGPISKSNLPEDSRPFRIYPGLRTSAERMTRDSAHVPYNGSYAIDGFSLGPSIPGPPTDGAQLCKYQVQQHAVDGSQFGYVNLPISFGSQAVSTVSPYVLLPGDELILGCDAGISAVPVSGTARVAFCGGDLDNTVTTQAHFPYAEPRQLPPAGLPTSGSLCEISGSFLIFEKGPAKLTLFGSMIREDKEKLFELNQNLTSDAIHEALHFDNPVVDQFDIQNRGEIAGSYTSDYMLGGMYGTFTMEQFQKSYPLISNGQLYRNQLWYPYGLHGPAGDKVERGRVRDFAIGSHSIYNFIQTVPADPCGIYVNQFFNNVITENNSIFPWFGNPGKGSCWKMWTWPMSRKLIEDAGGQIPGHLPETANGYTLNANLTTTPNALTIPASSITPAPNPNSKRIPGRSLDRHGMRYWNNKMLNTSKTSPLLRCIKASDFNERWFDTLMPEVEDWSERSGLLIESDEKTRVPVVKDVLNGLHGCRLNESASADGPSKPHVMKSAHKTAYPYHMMKSPRVISQDFKISLSSVPGTAGNTDFSGPANSALNIFDFDNCSDEFGPGASRVSWNDWYMGSNVLIESYWKEQRDILNSRIDPKACYDVMFRKGYDFFFRTRPKYIYDYTSANPGRPPDPPDTRIFVYTDDVIRLFYNKGPGGAHGYAYGVLDTTPKFTSAIYRAGKYGQNRDMLEQRKFGKFYNMPTTTRTVNSILPIAFSTIGFGEQDSPVQCYFVDSADGISIVDPYTTDCSNMDLEASSSCPYTDGHLCNRFDPLGIYVSARICVIKGTQIQTERGDISVEDVVVGDAVLSHDFTTSEMGYFDVLRTFSNTVDRWCRIKTVGGFELGCSLDHPIMRNSPSILDEYVVEDRELIASEASPGDTILVFNGGRMRDATVESVEIIDEQIDVYNMTVDDVHTYVSDGILSCNFTGIAKGCVRRGTQIPTDEGNISVEDIEVGSKVLSYNFKKSEMGYFDVLRTFTTIVEGWCKIVTDGGFELSCSLDHLVMSNIVENWELCVKDASPGDHVWIVRDGELIDDLIKTVEIFSDPVEVFNMTVSDVHTYFSDGILSHNFVLNQNAIGKGGGGATLDTSALQDLINLV